MYLLFLYSALVLFFLLAFTHPRHAIVLLAGLLPTYLLRFTIAGIPTNFFEVAVWLVLLAHLITYYLLLITFLPRVTGYLPVRLPAGQAGQAGWLLVTLFIIAATFSALLTPTLHSFGILKSWILTPIVFGFLITSLSSSEERGSLPVRQAGVRWINSLIISGVVVSIIGLLQLGALSRITSIYDVPNSLALFIAPLIILALFHRGCLNYLAALIMFAALLGTQSLAGLAAVILTLFIGLLFQRRLVTGYLPVRLPAGQAGQAGWLLVTMLLVASIFLTLTGRLTYFLQPLFNSSVQTSLTVRQQLWSISWELIKENPIRGIGLGQFEPAYQQKLHERFQKFSPSLGYLPVRLPAGQAGQAGWLLVNSPLPEFVYRDPHNWLLSFWLNTGLLGLLSFTTLNILALKSIFLPFRVPGSGLRAPALALLALLIFGLVDTIYWKNDLAALHWLLLGLLLRFM